jgi:hypothetical protein
MFVYMETFVLNWSLGIHLHGNVRYFCRNALVSKSLHLFIFISIDTLVASTQQWFVSKNCISAATCLPIYFLEMHTCHIIILWHVHDFYFYLYLFLYILTFLFILIYNHFVVLWMFALSFYILLGECIYFVDIADACYMSLLYFI